eukprot:3697384-Prorocentrum_lima.AAC.1
MEASNYRLSNVVQFWWHFQCTCLAYHAAATFLHEVLQLGKWLGQVAIPTAWMPRAREETPTA